MLKPFKGRSSFIQSAAFPLHSVLCDANVSSSLCQWTPLSQAAFVFTGLFWGFALVLCSRVPAELCVPWPIRAASGNCFFHTFVYFLLACLLRCFIGIFFFFNSSNTSSYNLLNASLCRAL